jgi:large subunit ribosomal protein L9
MEVILLEKVKKLGDLGDTVKVRPGYGRNFLLPQGKALPATEANRKVFEARKADLIKKAKALAADEGKLYGSVGPAEIVRAAADQGYEIKKVEIDMISGPIRQTGSYDIAVRLHTEVETSMTVVVVEEKAA